MASFNKKLNDLLVDTFKTIGKIEEASIRRSGHDLSVSEVHLLEAVAGAGEVGATVSDIAEELRITLPSVTVAVNKLVQKGYLSKEKDPSDGRRVYARLTPLGIRMDRMHRYFHRRLVTSIAEDMTEAEKDVLHGAMLKMKTFFEDRLMKEER